MKRLFSTLILILLSGCSASTEYDFDLSCPKEKFKWDERSNKDIVFACTSPKFFNVLCESNTVTYVDTVRYCTTHDGKSVRILIKN